MRLEERNQKQGGRPEDALPVRVAQQKQERDLLLAPSAQTEKDQTARRETDCLLEKGGFRNRDADRMCP
jgi:hypothetical protein